jgi:gliding motility-associated-like protein
LDQIPIAFIDQTGALDCNNSSLILDGSGSSPFNNLIFEWSTSNGNIISGEDTPNPEIDQGGVYNLTVTDIISGCSHTESVTIIVDMDQPTVVILPPGFINCYNPQIEIDASNSSTIGNLSYSWTSDPAGGIFSGGNTLNPTVNQGGTYTLTIENLENGCTESGITVVDEDTESPIAIANVNDDLDCITEEIQLSGAGSSIGPEYSYSWTGNGIVGGNTTLQPVVNLPGSYTLTVFNTENGCLNTDEVLVIEITDVPVGMEAVVIPPICYGERGSIEIVSVEGGAEPYIYSINNGETFLPFGFFTSLEPGDYNVLIQDANGCEYEEFFFIPSVPELLVNLEPELIIQLGESDQIIAIVNIPTSMIDTIVWSPVEGLSCTNCLNPNVMPLNETAYMVTVTDLDGCTASDQIILRVKKDRDIYIPNAFSPHNNDGINDVFMIFANDRVIKKVNSFQVFDRWGELVWEDFDFQPNDPARSWDGELKGEPMNPAVFVYWAEIEFIDGVKKLYKGDVTLMR